MSIYKNEWDGSVIAENLPELWEINSDELHLDFPDE